MDNKQSPFLKKITGRHWIAFLFIASGVLLFLRNISVIDNTLFDTLMSWPMLLIAIGIHSLIKQRISSGLVLILIGAYFFLRDMGIYWLSDSIGDLTFPLVLVIIGVYLIVRSKKKISWKNFTNGRLPKENQQSQSENGFIYSDTLFSGVHQVVLDEIFKGGIIRNNFGGTVIDLRRTSLAPGETYIDLECNFGGVEIYVPSDWKVSVSCGAFLGGCDDKRFRGAVVDQSRTLVIRGRVAFGGIEIKS